MFEQLFKGIFDTSAATVINPLDFLLCIGIALIIGLVLSFAYIYRSRYTKSFVFTLALLPAVVCVVIMMVNGNIGTGVAVAGAFSLVRFRSAPGSAKEIGFLFLAMGAGLISGMGYLGYAVIFTLIMAAITMLYSSVGMGSGKKSNLYKTLSITIPEDLNYTNVFDPILSEYTSSCELVRVKTTNMGSLFRLTYNITLKKDTYEKDFIDKLRCRNGNLEISISPQESAVAEL